MKVAIYPGTFNPWHSGHEDVLLKASHIFDKIIVAIGINSDKQRPTTISSGFESFEGLLVDFIKKQHPEACAVIRGLRNGYDLEYETNMQYWNEDLGLTIPIIYFITDRKHSHISSRIIREVNSLKEKSK